MIANGGRRYTILRRLTVGPVINIAQSRKINEFCTAGRVYVHAGVTVRKRWSSGVNRPVAGRTVKVAAVLKLDSLKTFGDVIDANGLVAIVECLTICLRKVGVARPATRWAPQVFSPLIARGHPSSYAPPTIRFPVP
jgi:hypothetical protein